MSYIDPSPWIPRSMPFFLILCSEWPYFPYYMYIYTRYRYKYISRDSSFHAILLSYCSVWPYFPCYIYIYTLDFLFYAILYSLF